MKYQDMKMSRIFLTTLSLWLLLLAIPSEAKEGPVTMPLNFHSLFPFLGRVNEQNTGQDVEENTPQEQTPQQSFNTPHKLKVGFYARSCPNAEKIVADTFAQIVKTNPGAIGNILRLVFHDCFVKGCDASILLDYAQNNNDAVEKSSMFNGFLLKGADMIDDIKAKLEEECPGIVSCADIISFVTNEAMSLAGLPPRKRLGGRRDGMVSLASTVEANNLPLPDWTMDQMIELFTRKGFSVEEMVIMIGAHSVGVAHCDGFYERVNNFRKTGKPDPTLTVEVIEEIKRSCPDFGTNMYRNPPVNFDPTPTVLDNLFFKEMVERRKTLLITDSHLLEDPRTFPFVQKMAADPNMFPSKFPDVMLKLSTLDVLTGYDGEVRKICRATN
ncbi:hypothetical protein VNO78_08960 [Psophocarpus tetragonolobus]|uniref:Peroxidase n=1 Tax=Psophocarpus tetragonolobus TaxID=3891 RepID=A0AAN9XTA3_PSOTE